MAMVLLVRLSRNAQTSRGQGHIVSTRTVQTVPWFMVNDSGFDKDTIDESGIEKACARLQEVLMKGCNCWQQP